MDIKKIETKKPCRFCDGVGFHLGKVTVKLSSMEAPCINCNNCKGKGEITDYHYEITYKKKKFIVDTLK